MTARTFLAVGMTARTFLAVEEEEGAVPSTKEAVFFRPVLSNYPINLSIIRAKSDIVPFNK